MENSVLEFIKIQGCIKISSTVMIQMTFQLCKLGISW